MSIFGLLIILLLVPILFIIISVISLFFRLLNSIYSFKPNKKHTKYNNYKYDSDDYIYNKIRELIEEKKERGEKIFSDEVGEYVNYEACK